MGPQPLGTFWLSHHLALPCFGFGICLLRDSLTLQPRLASDLQLSFQVLGLQTGATNPCCFCMIANKRNLRSHCESGTIWLEKVGALEEATAG